MSSSTEISEVEFSKSFFIQSVQRSERSQIYTTDLYCDRRTEKLQRDLLLRDMAHKKRPEPDVLELS